METLQGPVTNCQHTLRVSGGGNNNSSSTTTYIALFRVNGRPVEFRTNRPNSVSDGDQVIVAGHPTRTNSFRAYACRNVTTGELSNSGVWGNVFAAIFVPVVLIIFTLVAGSMFHQYGLLLGIVLIALALGYFVRQAILAHQALNLVRA